jgi:hypothetical protein
MSRLLNVLRSKRQNGRVVVIPHLYFTYLFISLLSSACYIILGRDVLVTLFSWYYINGIDTFLLMLAIIEYASRVALINKGHIR